MVTKTDGHGPSLMVMPGATRPLVWHAETMKRSEVTKSHFRSTRPHAVPTASTAAKSPHARKSPLRCDAAQPLPRSASGDDAALRLASMLARLVTCARTSERMAARKH
eukprot:3427853-Prymnesium_polylepis.1